MEWLQNVTLVEAYEQVKRNGFALWKVEGNYMNVQTPVTGNNMETWVFLGESIFLLGLSVESQGFNVMASRVDFIDVWFSVKEKYPQLFQEGVKGELHLIP